MVKLFQPRHAGSMVAAAYGDWVSLQDYASMYEAKDARIAELEAKLAAVTDWANRVADASISRTIKGDDTKAWKMLYRLNRQAHPERYKEDFKAMSKKQLRNALHGRIQYLLASDQFLTRPPTEQEARFLQKHERLMKILQPGHRGFMPRA